MPFPVQPSPRTWLKNDIITVPRLRADMSNLAQLLTMRPVLVAQAALGTFGANTGVISPVILDTEFLDNWNGHIAGASAQATYTAKLTGWYLCDGVLTYSTVAGTGQWEAGIQAVQNSVTSNSTGQILTSNGVNNAAPGASDLVQLNSGTSDTVSLFAFQNSTATAAVGSSTWFKTEWVGLPTTGFTGSVTGTVVTSPQPAALWPPGAGTQITNVGGIAAGATSMTVGANTGMVVNGTLGLDFYEGQAMVPTAETVSVTSVSGTTIGISATTYPHGGTATPGYVAVPVSAAWMNQQCRDLINFLAYPPMLRATATTTQAVAVQVFPASTQITLGGVTVDNFSGFSASTYTFPVSGVYYVYGCVPFAAGVNNYHLGISISGGTVQWGDSIRNQTAGNAGAPSVRKHIRVTAGQTLTLQACIVNTAVSTVINANAFAVLIAVWRGF